MTKVTFYTKPDCPLCEEALEVVERVRAEAGFKLERVDISSDNGLRARYGESVPVVAIDGDEIFHYRVDERELRDRIEVPSRSATEITQ